MPPDQEGEKSCCGQSGAVTCSDTSKSGELTEEEVQKLDFNEWAGKFDSEILGLRLNASRLVRDLCRQAVGHLVIRHVELDISTVLDSMLEASDW